MNNRLFGSEGEALAETYLLERGYTIITRNWAVGAGELDLVAWAPDGVLAFIEVKRVRDARFGVAAEKLTPAKCRQVGVIAHRYLEEHKLLGVPARVDAVAITGVRIELFTNCIALA